MVTYIHQNKARSQPKTKHCVKNVECLVIKKKAIIKKAIKKAIKKSTTAKKEKKFTLSTNLSKGKKIRISTSMTWAIVYN